LAAPKSVKLSSDKQSRAKRRQQVTGSLSIEPHEAAPGTIRGDFGLETAKNLIHASDAPETAAAEIALWFTSGELVDYTRGVDDWVLSDEE
jgi:nucleoside diphosphate kinase